MGEIINIANVILIISCIYFGLNYSWAWYLYLFFGLAIGSWSYHAFSNERKEYLKSQIELTKAKTDYYRKKKLPL